MRIVVQEALFDPGAELSTFSAAVAGVGAVVSFSGIVRDDHGDLDALEIEHYAGMTERALTDQATEAATRFNLADVLVIHRHGRLSPDEPIMMVATAAAHRKEAFAGADFLMDYLKSRAPFWKKELRAGSADWVEAKQADEDALAEWSR
ncbi:MAG: molybdenum cofactor biosynthesis protein MoaE [Pseudomonadota bacterium]